MTRRHFWTLAKYGLGVALLVWVIWSNWNPADGSPGLAEALKRPFHWGPLLVALSLFAISLLLTFYRWFLLVRAQDLPFALSDAMRLGMVGFALSTFLPGSVGGDIIKAACVAREQSRRTVAVATVLFDRILGLCGLFWVCALMGAGCFVWQADLLQRNVGLATIVYGSWLLVGGSILFWIVIGFVPRGWIEPFADRLARIPKLGGPLGELWRAAWCYRSRTWDVLRALGLAMIGHIGFILTFFFAALTLCSPETIPSLVEHFIIVPVGLTIQAGFPTPGGAGAAEFGFGKLYELVNPNFAANGVVGSLMLRVLTWCLGATGYVIYLRMRPSLTVANIRETVEKSADRKLAAAEA